MNNPKQLISKFIKASNNILPLSKRTVSDEYIGELLKMVYSLMDLSGKQFEFNNPDIEVVENWRKPIRQFIQMILNEAHWLSAETKSQLKLFLETYPAELFVGRYIFTADWFSHKCEAQWQTNLAEFSGKSDLHFLEIGSYEGRASVWLLDNILTHPTSRLTCIDPFPSEYGKRFDMNIERSGASGKVIKISALSTDGLRGCGKQFFDFVYIDGDHSAPCILEDAVLSWPMIKDGGLVTFDDYSFDDTKLAWRAFDSVYHKFLEIIHEGNQLTVRKLSQHNVGVDNFYTIS